MPRDEQFCQVAVIGSGPGGAITAALLAEAGRDVVLIEEGSRPGPEPQFSLDEMRRKYRNGGICTTMGSKKISWVEGRCLGGGSEVNSGLYHRTPGDVLEIWRQKYGVTALGCADMERHFQAGEKALSVSSLPCEAPAASLKLAQGAEALGWRAMEVPRWVRYQNDGTSVRQTMSRTFIPRAEKAGCRIWTNSKALRIREDHNGPRVDVQTASGISTLCCEDVFVCAGAVQTPALLRRSGFRDGVGNTLAMHPTTKVVARFDDTVSDQDMLVAVHQVKEFAPRFSFGCSISSEPYVALALASHADSRQRVLRDWRRSAIYYVMTNGEANGRVRTLPWASDPLVNYGPSTQNLRDLARGLRSLCELLFAAGAYELHPTIAGMAPLTSRDDLSRLPTELAANESSLMTIHLFSSCPMGKRDDCPADSFGKLRQASHTYINDASLLPTAPGVNPQGTIMALARRNVMHYLDQL